MGPTMAMKLVLYGVVLVIVNTLVTKNVSTAVKIASGEEISPKLPQEIQHRQRKPLLKKGLKWDVVVARDGSGNFSTIKEALEASAQRREGGRFVIYVKAGTYKEYVVVKEHMRNITLVGDGMGHTIICGNRSIRGASRKGKIRKAATVDVSAGGFVAIDITIQNTAGPHAYQAPAITVNSSHAAFYRCGFEGYQDTVYAMRGLQVYSGCDIYGTVDFIFGDASVIIQYSHIYLRKSVTGNQIVIAASKRDSPFSGTGIVIRNCQIKAAPDLKPELNSYQIYLGRPWRRYARTIYIYNDFDVPVHPDGWLEWKDRQASDINTVDFREYNNRGIGSSTEGRVKWKGVREISDQREAEQFTIANFIQGNAWLPNTGLPYNSSKAQFDDDMVNYMMT